MAAALAVTMAVTPVSSVKAFEGDPPSDTSHGEYDEYGTYYDYEKGYYWDTYRFSVWKGMFGETELPPCKYDSNGNRIDVNQPATNFDAEYYAQTYPDVANAVGTDRDALYNHYVTFGKAEGRQACAPTV